MYASLLALFLLVMAKSADPLVDTAKKLNAKNIESITAHMRGETEGKGTDIDVTADAEKIIELLRRSHLQMSGNIGCGCIPFCILEIRPKGRSNILLNCHFHRSLFYTPRTSYGKTFLYESEVFFFLDALQFNKTDRVFTEKEYGDLLARYATSRNGSMEAFCRLAEMNDGRAAPLVPAYLSRTKKDERIRSLQAMERMRDVNDPIAIDAVKARLYSQDINECRQACSVLTNWGHLEVLRTLAFQKQANASQSFTTFVASWFIDNDRYLDAVTLIRTQGLDRFDKSYYHYLLKSFWAERQDPKGTPRPERRPMTLEEKRQVILLVADISEQDGRMCVLFWRDLWDALGVEYDPQSKRMVKHLSGEDGPYIYDDAVRAKEAIKALREWCRREFSEADRDQETHSEATTPTPLGGT